MSTPPTMTRRNLRLTILTHPFELALGLALAINGLSGLAGYATPSIAALPPVPRYAYLVVSVIGGIGVIVGLILNDPPKHIGLGKTLERASLYLVASSYAVLAVVIAASNGSAGLPSALVSLVIGAACVARARAIREAALIILDQLRARTVAQDNGRDE